MSKNAKRRRYQFSLLTLLLAISLLCIGPGGYIAYEQNKARRQKAAVQAIEKLEGSVEYDQTGPARSAAMRQILGDDSFGKIEMIHFGGPKVSDADLVHLRVLNSATYVTFDFTQIGDAGLVHLRELKKLTHLWLDNSRVSDVGMLRLAELKTLTHLSLRHTQITDVGLERLAGLKKLELLNLGDTQVTDEGVTELQESLPNCEIYR